jgi:hypothetical protein
MIRFPIREPAWIKPLLLRRMGLALFVHGTTFCRDILRGFMSRFRFRSLDGSDIAPQEWLSIWSDRYPFTASSWEGAFYPKGMRSADYLTFYSEHFHTVEVDSTFYGCPSARTVNNWDARTPQGFILG